MFDCWTAAAVAALFYAGAAVLAHWLPSKPNTSGRRANRRSRWLNP